MTGWVKPHHRYVLSELLCQIDSLDETIAHFDQEIEKYCAPFEDAVVLLDTIHRIARASAEMIVAEIGSDMTRFPSANHLAAWAGLAPGHNESARKRRYGKTRQGNRVLKTRLVQEAHAVCHTKGNYLSTQCHRLVGRRGKNKAAVAVAHSILVIAYHMLKPEQPYQDLGANYFDELRPETTAKRLAKRIEKLGYQVAL